jgi:hypothetical protein
VQVELRRVNDEPTLQSLFVIIGGSTGCAGCALAHPNVNKKNRIVTIKNICTYILIKFQFFVSNTASVQNKSEIIIMCIFYQSLFYIINEAFIFRI